MKPLDIAVAALERIASNWVDSSDYAADALVAISAAIKAEACLAKKRAPKGPIRSSQLVVVPNRKR